MRKIYLAGDHAGFFVKEKLKHYFDSRGIKYEDFGPYKYEPKDDYPDFVIPLAKRISKKGDVGIIIAGSGIGEAMCANRFKGVRAVLFHGGKEDIVNVSREHDNSNVLCVGSRFVSFNKLMKVMKIFLDVKFQKGRHVGRLGKFDGLGEK